MNEIRPRAVSIGFGLNVLGSWLSFFLMVTLIPGLAALDEDQQAVFLATDTGAQVVGSVWTLLGGFLAAHLSPRHELAAAFAVGILSTLFAFVVAFSGPSAVPIEYEALGIATTVPLAVAGGWLRAATRRAPAAP